MLGHSVAVVANSCNRLLSVGLMTYLQSVDIDFSFISTFVTLSLLLRIFTVVKNFLYSILNGVKVLGIL